MGHCYEFGTTIVGGCGHAMTVGPEGGACQCPTCGAHCEGRFKACEAILATPGYVPRVAPGWAVERQSPPAYEPNSLGGVRVPLVVSGGANGDTERRELEHGDAGPAGAPTGDTADGERADVEIVLSELEDSPNGEAATSAESAASRELVAVVDDVRRDLSQRDTELVRVLERMADLYEGLADRLDADRRERLALVEVIAGLADRLTAIDVLPGAKPPHRSTVIGGSITPSSTELPPSPPDMPDMPGQVPATLAEGSA